MFFFCSISERQRTDVPADEDNRQGKWYDEVFELVRQANEADEVKAERDGRDAIKGTQRRHHRL